MNNDSNHQNPTTPKKSQDGHYSTEIYAIQCAECFKWRLIATKEEFEEIRSEFTSKPFICDHKPSASCEDPADIEYDSTRLWAIHKPDIPKVPKGFKRFTALRKDLSKLDVTYSTPTGKRIRSMTEASMYLQANTDIKGVPISDFSFSTPRIMKDTVPENVAGTSSAKKLKKCESED